MCKFCILGMSVQIQDFGSVYAVLDKYPVTEGHWLIIPFRHCADYFSLTRQELADTDVAIHSLRNVLAIDLTVSGFNIGWNCGKDSGQTVMHAHCHLIPRRSGDTLAPEGGVRGVIHDKQSYSHS